MRRSGNKTLSYHSTMMHAARSAACAVGMGSHPNCELPPEVECFECGGGHAEYIFQYPDESPVPLCLGCRPKRGRFEIAKVPKNTSSADYVRLAKAARPWWLRDGRPQW